MAKHQLCRWHSCSALWCNFKNLANFTSMAPSVSFVPFSLPVHSTVDGRVLYMCNIPLSFKHFEFHTYLILHSLWNTKSQKCSISKHYRNNVGVSYWNLSVTGYPNAWFHCRPDSDLVTTLPKFEFDEYDAALQKIKKELATIPWILINKNEIDA